MLCRMNIKMENNGLLHRGYKRFMNYPHATIYGYILNSKKNRGHIKYYSRNMQYFHKLLIFKLWTLQQAEYLFIWSWLQ